MAKMQDSLTITLPSSEAKRLRAAAHAFGTTPDAMVRHIAAKATQDILSMPEESLEEYHNKEEIVHAIKTGLRDYRQGNVLRKLPKKMRRS